MNLRRACLTALALASSLMAVLLLGPPAPPPVSGNQLVPGTRKVMKSDEQWAKQLTGPQFLVTRRKQTEPAFSGAYVNNHARGTYLCVCCGAELFSSTAKFDSGTGWPSFWRPISPQRLETHPDNSTAEARIEVVCRDCVAHLGHVFNDGPPPTGLRFCLNSLALKFARDTRGKVATTSEAAARKKTSRRTRGKAAPQKPAAKPEPQEPPKEAPDAPKPEEGGSDTGNPPTQS